MMLARPFAAACLMAWVGVCAAQTPGMIYQSASKATQDAKAHSGSPAGAATPASTPSTPSPQGLADDELRRISAARATVGSAAAAAAAAVAEQTAAQLSPATPTPKSSDGVPASSTAPSPSAAPSLPKASIAQINSGTVATQSAPSLPKASSQPPVAPSASTPAPAPASAPAATASAASPVVASPAASGDSKAAAPATAAPSTSNAPATFVAPTAGAGSRPTAASRPAATGASAAKSPDSTPGVSVTRKPDGSRVIRAQVDPAMVQAEAEVASQLPVPSFRAGGVNSLDASSSSVSPGGLGGDLKPLPKWVAGGLDRTSGRTQIVVLPGVTEMVRIARGFPNRFTTPFESAEVITTDENLTHDGVGGAVIVATASDRPIGIFIADRNSDRAIPIVLIPEDIPQRDLKLILDDSWGPPQVRPNADKAAAATPLPSAQSDYVDYVKSVMRQLAKGDVPDGHALSPMQPELVPACQIPGLNLKLGQMLEGARSRIAVYVASNGTQSTVPVQESGCFRAGVIAVSAFPRPVLEPGQDTEVYVLLRKDLEMERSSAKRRPTLVN